MKKMIRPPILLAIMMSAMPLLGVSVAQGAHHPFHGEIQALVDDVNFLVGVGDLKQGQGNSLTKKLEAADKHLAKDRTRGACQMLNVFIHQVEAFINGAILDPVEGQDLIDKAIEIGEIAVCSLNP